MYEIILYVSVFIASYFGVEIFRKWTLKKELYDIPNERSSHQVPTPRGGGIIFVVISLVAYSLFSYFLLDNFSAAYLAGAVFIAFISWLDDLYTISFVWRFAVHSISALLIIYFCGYFQFLEIPFMGIVDLGYFAIFPTFLWIVWLTNAFNFMDGIDGIAGLQAVISGSGWLIVGKIFGLQSTSILGGMVAISCLGFLIHNWQPAKIFMGDVGSAFLGYTFAVIPFVESKSVETSKSFLPNAALIGLVIVWLFTFDTVLTFLKRLFRGEKVWQAHREHIYQQLVIKGFKHKTVSIFYGVLGLAVITVLCVLIYTQIFNEAFIAFSLVIESLILILSLKYPVKTLT